MRLNKLTLNDKAIFNKYLNSSEHELCVYSFENIYIWRGLFEISWRIVSGNLCVFFQDKLGAFLYLSPLAKNINPLAVDETFRILDKLNVDPEVARIENAENSQLEFYRGLGLECRQKSLDYLCLRSNLAGLTGDKFKAKRASFNYFVKNYKFEYLAFTRQDKDGCLKLYRSWVEERRRTKEDALYRMMQDDSLNAMKILLEEYEKLNCVGRLVKIEGTIKAFSFGFKLNSHAFCILYEITDLSVKGLAQFIFREFCRELSEYKYINIMDDSGLENLRKVKLSYKPVRLIPAYIVRRNK